MNENSARKLSASIGEFTAVAKQGKTGEFLVVDTKSNGAALSDAQKEDMAATLAEVLSQPDICSHLANAEIATELVAALRSSIRLSEIQTAVAQLQQHLDSGEDAEQVYQEWCDNHSWAFGNGYVVRDKVRGISVSDNLDLMLPTVFVGYRDIVELKRPGMDVLRYDKGHRNFYFASEVSKAMGQCHRYLDVLHVAAAKGLQDHPEVVAYHPRAIIVIGRSNDWNQEKMRALHGLNRRLSGITVMTYDQLLAQGERMIQVMMSEEWQAKDSGIVEATQGDEIPF